MSLSLAPLDESTIGDNGSMSVYYDDNSSTYTSTQRHTSRSVYVVSGVAHMPRHRVVCACSAVVAGRRSSNGASDSVILNRPWQRRSFFCPTATKPIKPRNVSPWRERERLASPEHGERVGGGAARHIHTDTQTFQTAFL